MSDPTPPPGFELDEEVPPPPPGFEVDSPAADTGVLGSPLEKALKAQTGDVVTVETPTGPAKFTRSGARFFDRGEAQQMLDAGGARFKEHALATLVDTLGNGGLAGPQQAGLLAVTGPPGGPNAALPGESWLEHFRRVRDRTARDLEGAGRTSPAKLEIAGRKVNPLPLLASAAPSIIAPNPAGILGRLGLSAAVGAEQAGAASDADLTKGEVLPFLKDTGRGAGYGLVAGGVAEGVTAPMRLITRGAGSRIGDAVAEQAAKDTAAVEKEIASTRGQLGAESQKASRMFENTQRAAGGGVAPAGQSSIDPALQGKALLALSDPSTVRLQEKVLNRTLGEMPAQTAVVERLEQELAQKTANAGTDAGKRTSDYFSKSAGSELLPKAGRALKNIAVGAGGGTALGVGQGLMKGGDFSDLPSFIKMGAVAGVAGGSGLRTMVKNAANSPRIRAGGLEALIKMSQAGQRAVQAGARSAAGPESRLRKEDEEAIQAFSESP